MVNDFSINLTDHLSYNRNFQVKTNPIQQIQFMLYYILTLLPNLSTTVRKTRLFVWPNACINSCINTEQQAERGRTARGDGNRILYVTELCIVVIASCRLIGRLHVHMSLAGLDKLV